MSDTRPPTCFISYSWDSEEQKEWVRALAERLQNNGVDTRLDQWDLHFGMNVARFMEENISDADFVLMVCTPGYAERANSTKGGVGWEKQVITGEMYYHIAEETKFVPLLRHVDQVTAIPRFLRCKYYVDFSSDDAFSANVDALLHHLHDTPRHVRPQLGTVPNLPTAVPTGTNRMMVSKNLQETFELSEIAGAWEAADRPYHHVEGLTENLKALIRHPPENSTTPADPTRGFLLLAGLHHGGNWLYWLGENLDSPRVVAILLSALKVSYERVRFRAHYALQYVDPMKVQESMAVPGFKIGATVKEIVEQYDVTGQVMTYLLKTVSNSDQQLADKARAVIREIETFGPELPGR